MRTVQLNPRKPAIGHQPRRVDKLLRDGIDVRLRHLPRTRERDHADELLQVAVSQTHRDGTGRNGRSEDAPTACDAERLPAGVNNLHDGRRPVLLAGLGVFGPRCDEVRVLLLPGVFALQGGVEWRSQVVDVDLDVAYL